MSLPRNTYYHYTSPHGALTIGASSRGITRIAFSQEQFEGHFAPTDITNRAASQLQEYLAGKRAAFDVPLDLQGSSFQKAVWSEVAAIPYGETRTPAEIATSMGKPGSHRSVGTAIRQNKLTPFIPTHRVVIPSATGRQAKIFRAFQALERKSRDE